MALVFLSLGSNQGIRKDNLSCSIEIMEKHLNTKIVQSRIFEYEPWGFESESHFLNMVISLESDIDPHDLLLLIKKIEKQLGRVKNGNRYSDRPIDIDILIYDDLILSSPELGIPHPLISERKFVLEPLCDLAPELVHPVLKERMIDLLEKLH